MKSLFFRIKRFLEPRGGVGGVLRITRSYIRTNGLRRTVRRVMGIAVRSMFSGYLRTTVEAQVSAQFSSLVSGADSSLKILNRMPYDLRKLLHSSYRAPLVGRHPEYSAAIRLQRDAKSLIKAVAFYMPQPEPEVGPGFQRVSGWSRVGRQAPQFVGHCQPHLPDDPSVCNAPSSASMSRQAELARQYGIHAFCFYHLLDASNGDELPVALETILADPAINIHIALCLTVRSSLSNEEPATDSKAPRLAWLQSSELMSLAHTLVTAMRDPRWVRVDGKPMLIILDDRRKMRCVDWRRRCALLSPKRVGALCT